MATLLKAMYTFNATSIEIPMTCWARWFTPVIPATQKADKENRVFPHHGAVRKNEIISLVGKWMKMEIIRLSEIRQSLKDKSYIFSLGCRI